MPLFAAPVVYSVHPTGLPVAAEHIRRAVIQTNQHAKIFEGIDITRTPCENKDTQRYSKGRPARILLSIVPWESQPIGRSDDEHLDGAEKKLLPAEPTF